jgi:transcription antitermination factor NusG
VFPGYVFTRGFTNRQRSEICNHVAYVIKFLRFGDVEGSVTDAELAALQLMLASGAAVTPRLRLIPGLPFRVRHGCMGGLVGEFLRHSSVDELIVNMPLFGRSVAIPIGTDMVETI